MSSDTQKVRQAAKEYSAMQEAGEWAAVQAEFEYVVRQAERAAKR